MSTETKQHDVGQSLTGDTLGECPLSEVESLEEYFSQEIGPNGTCRPCQIEPLASLYLEVLDRTEEQAAAQALIEAYDSKDILTIARAMDTIKAGARDEVRVELERLDCFAESFEAKDGEGVGAETV